MDPVERFMREHRPDVPYDDAAEATLQSVLGAAAVPSRPRTRILSFALAACLVLVVGVGAWLWIRPTTPDEAVPSPPWMSPSSTLEPSPSPSPSGSHSPSPSQSPADPRPAEACEAEALLRPEDFRPLDDPRVDRVEEALRLAGRAGEPIEMMNDRWAIVVASESDDGMGAYHVLVVDLEAAGEAAVSSTGDTPSDTYPYPVLSNDKIAWLQGPLFGPSEIVLRDLATGQSSTVATGDVGAPLFVTDDTLLWTDRDEDGNITKLHTHALEGGTGWQIPPALEAALPTAGILDARDGAVAFLLEAGAESGYGYDLHVVDEHGDLKVDHSDGLLPSGTVMGRGFVAYPVNTDDSESRTVARVADVKRGVRMDVWMDYANFDFDGDVLHVWRGVGEKGDEIVVADVPLERFAKVECGR